MRQFQILIWKPPYATCYIAVPFKNKLDTQIVMSFPFYVWLYVISVQSNDPN